MRKNDELEYGQRLVRESGPSDAFVIAAANDWRHIMGWLLDEKKVDIDCRSKADGKKSTALHTAADLGLKKVTEFLIGRGADLNLKNKNDVTPLMQACMGWDKKHAAVALLLVDAGADVNHVRRSDKVTALSAAQEGSGDAALIKALKRAGAKTRT